jgi:hypothetical protein
MVGTGVAVWGAGGVVAVWVGTGVWDVHVGLGAGVDWPHQPFVVFQLDAQGCGPHCPFQLFPELPWLEQFQPGLPPPPELAAETLARVPASGAACAAVPVKMIAAALTARQPASTRMRIPISRSSLPDRSFAVNCDEYAGWHRSVR